MKKDVAAHGIAFLDRAANHRTVTNVRAFSTVVLYHNIGGKRMGGLLQLEPHRAIDFETTTVVEVITRLKFAEHGRSRVDGGFGQIRHAGKAPHRVVILYDLFCGELLTRIESHDGDLSLESVGWQNDFTAGVSGTTRRAVSTAQSGIVSAIPFVDAVVRHFRANFNTIKVHAQLFGIDVVICHDDLVELAIGRRGNFLGQKLISTVHRLKSIVSALQRER